MVLSPNVVFIILLELIVKTPLYVRSGWREIPKSYRVSPIPCYSNKHISISNQTDALQPLQDGFPLDLHPYTRPTTEREIKLKQYF